VKYLAAINEPRALQMTIEALNLSSNLLTLQLFLLLSPDTAVERAIKDHL
jgi:hypothetical protein